MSATDVIGPQALPELQAQVEEILAEAERQGASACEVAVSVGQGLSTTVRARSAPSSFMPATEILIPPASGDPGDEASSLMALPADSVTSSTGSRLVF